MGDVDVERRELEERLEVVHREYALLTSALSHDLQEPLRMVTGFMELLQGEYGDTLDAPAQEYVEFAAAGARRMQGMVDGLVRLSRASTDVISPAPVRPEEAWLDVQLALRREIEAVDAEVIADPLPTIQHDPAQLRGLLGCLLDNALRFHGERRPRVRLRAGSSARGATLVVEDEGVGPGPGLGPSPDGTERAFRPFGSLHPDRPERGPGLGLCVARRIAHRHGQQIWLEANEPQGTRACFTVRTVEGGQV